MRVFVTGASGHIASGVIPELVAAGHDVTGLARSDAAATAVTALGATVRRGDLDDLDGLAVAAAESDGVIHLAQRRDRMLSGDIDGALAAQLSAVNALGDALAGTGKPFVAASAIGGVGQLGRAITEDDASAIGPETAVLRLADRGVASSVVRISPITHSILDRHGFARILISIAKQTGVAGYAGNGANRWPSVHTLDVAHLFRLALEDASAGARWHAVGDEGIPIREIAQSIGDHLSLPAANIPDDRLQAHFGFLARLIALDLPASAAKTRRLLGWEPVHPGLLADFDIAGYFAPSSATR